MKMIEVLKKGHSRSLRTKIVSHIGDDAVRFKELVNLYLDGPYRITQRAAWPLSYCVQKHPHLVKSHLKTLINFLDRPDTHVAVRRNTVRLLQFIDLPKSLQAKVADICFAFLSDRKEPVAVRVFSMTVLANIAREQPDLRNEIVIQIEDHLPYGSSAFKNRGARILKQLKGR